MGVVSVSFVRSRMSAYGTKRTSRWGVPMSASDPHSRHFVVRTLREEYGPNFADAVGGLSELDLAAIFRDGMNG